MIMLYGQIISSTVILVQSLLLIATMVLTENLLLTSSWCGNMNALRSLVHTHHQLFEHVSLCDSPQTSEMTTTICTRIDKSLSLMKLHHPNDRRKTRRQRIEYSMELHENFGKIYDYIHSARLSFMNKPYTRTFAYTCLTENGGILLRHSLSQSVSRSLRSPLEQWIGLDCYTQLMLPFCLFDNRTRRSHAVKLQRSQPKQYAVRFMGLCKPSKRKKKEWKKMHTYSTTVSERVRVAVRESEMETGREIAYETTWIINWKYNMNIFL